MKNETTLTLDESRRGALWDAPSVLKFPPALFLGTLALGLLLRSLWIWPLAPGSIPATWMRIAGAAVVIAGASVTVWGRQTMVRAGTNLAPVKPTLAIVTAGPFRFTRNPLYTGNTVIYLGLTLIFNSTWLLALFVPMIFVLRWGIIEREERYLEARFGEVYLAYQARVRRWL
jgi:protein-S-isoprenylcysteine O-methyltransferase Ste14